MTFLQKLLASLHHRAEGAATYEQNLRAEDGFVSPSRIGSRGFLRIF